MYLSNLRGTKDFQVSIGNSTEDVTEIIASGTFQDPIPAGEKGEVVDMTVLRLEEPVVGHYIEYKCTSWYRQACALQYIGVYESISTEEANKGK